MFAFIIIYYVNVKTLIEKSFDLIRFRVCCFRFTGYTFLGTEYPKAFVLFCLFVFYYYLFLIIFDETTVDKQNKRQRKIMLEASC